MRLRRTILSAVCATEKRRARSTSTQGLPAVPLALVGPARDCDSLEGSLRSPREGTSRRIPSSSSSFTARSIPARRGAAPSRRRDYAAVGRLTRALRRPARPPVLLRRRGRAVAAKASSRARARQGLQSHRAAGPQPCVSGGISFDRGREPLASPSFLGALLGHRRGLPVS